MNAHLFLFFLRYLNLCTAGQEPISSKSSVSLDALTVASLLLNTGARNIDYLFNLQQLPVLSQQLLTHMAAKQKPESLRLSWNEEEGIGLEFDCTRGVHA